MFRKIDLHTHILPPNCPDWNVEFGETGWIKIVTDPETNKVYNMDMICYITRRYFPIIHNSYNIFLFVYLTV